MPIGNEYARERTTDGNPPGGEPSSIAIRTPNWLGDLLICTAFIGAVLQRFPQARVDLIVRAGFEALPLPHRGEILPFDRARIRAGAFGRSLRGRGYSHFFVLPPSFSAAWMAWRSGTPHRPGTRGQFRGWLLSPALNPSATPRSVHLLREYMELLRPWGIPAEPLPAASLPLAPGWVERHRPREAEGPPYVVIAPGAEYGPAKQWPLRHYAAVAAKLHDLGWRVVVAGLEKDRDLGDKILAGVKSPRGVTSSGNLCGKTDLVSLTALLAGARLVISNDSGAMHLAASLGRPQVALFGSTNPVWTAPLNPRARVITRNEPCSPCYKRTCPLGHLNCLEKLPPGEVVKQALALLGEEGRE